MVFANSRTDARLRAPTSVGEDLGSLELAPRLWMRQRRLCGKLQNRARQNADNRRPSRFSSDRQHHFLRETREQPAQIVEAKSDTAPGRREIRPRAMQKDRAAAIFAARMEVVI